MRAGIFSVLMAVAAVSLLAAQVPDSGSDEPSKTGKAAADDTQGTKAQPARGFSQRGGPPQIDRGGFRGGPPGFQPGASRGFVPAPPTTTTRTQEFTERPGMGQPRSLAPLPKGAGSGKSLLLDACFAQTAEAAAQPSAAELLAMEREGKLASSSRVWLLLVEDLPGFTQFGALTNKVSGVTATNTRVLPIYTTVNVGTMVQAIGRVEDDGTIVLQVSIEKSELVSSTEPPETRKPEDITRLVAQTTVRLKDGEPVVLSSGPVAGGEAKTQNWIVVSCRAL